MDNITIIVKISGTVQGVFYRKSTHTKAVELGVTGWVSNNEDGTVSATFQGTETDVDALLDWCHIGPQKARVTHIDIKTGPSSPTYDTFSIL